MFNPSTGEPAVDLASQQLVKQSPGLPAAGVLSPGGLGAQCSLWWTKMEMNPSISNKFPIAGGV